jgi:electron transport complex protein RnfB
MMAVLLISAIFAFCGLILGLSAIRFRVEGDPVADKINALLPQTQCGQCGYPGCRPYAQAVAKGECDIDLCPPGGEETVRAMAELLGVEPKPLANQSASEKPKSIAQIGEENCIGCMLCIQSCPVDAILGAAKCMHTVIASECTGCELCLPPCPVDCIRMIPLKMAPKIEHWATLASKSN